MAKHPRKGIAGKGTGGAARTAIRTARKRGCTSKTIGRAANRSPSTINNIASGNIRNPPRNLAGNVRKCKAKKR